MKHDPDFMIKITQDCEARNVASKLLEVKEWAGLEELKKAYRKAASRYHPDHNGNTPEANKRFVLIKCAYELLAFGTPCEQLTQEIASWSGFEENERYKLDNAWGHFLWWRDKFFEPENKKGKSHGKKHPSCI